MVDPNPDVVYGTVSSVVPHFTISGTAETTVSSDCPIVGGDGTTDPDFFIGLLLSLLLLFSVFLHFVFSVRHVYMYGSIL